MDNTYTVYMHTNKINGKKYIGITGREPKVRWGINGNGYWGNPHFSNSIKKYGWDNFEHTILYTNLSKEEAETKEIELIALYDTTDMTKGYNRHMGGGSNGKHTPETLKLLSEREKKVVYMYNRYTGEFIREFDSTLSVENELHIPNPDISAVCLKKVKTAHGYVFRYKVDGYEYGEKLPEEEIRYVNKNNTFVKVAQYDLDGNFIKVYDSLIEAVRTIFHPNTNKRIQFNKNENILKSHGYFWKRIYDTDLDYVPNLFQKENKEEIAKTNHNNRFKKVAQYDMDMNYLATYKSIAEASRVTKTRESSITSCCKGIYRHANNYIWKYVE